MREASEPAVRSVEQGQSTSMFLVDIYPFPMLRMDGYLPIYPATHHSQWVELDLDVWNSLASQLIDTYMYLLFKRLMDVVRD